MTGDAGSFSMELSHYDPVPANVQQQLIVEFKPAADEDWPSRAGARYGRSATISRSAGGAGWPATG